MLSYIFFRVINMNRQESYEAFFKFLRTNFHPSTYTDSVFQRWTFCWTTNRCCCINQNIWPFLFNFICFSEKVELFFELEEEINYLQKYVWLLCCPTNKYVNLLAFGLLFSSNCYIVRQGAMYEREEVFLVASEHTCM